MLSGTDGSAASVAPIPYRMQNGGDYHIPSMVLRDGVGDAGATGFDIHLERPAPHD